MPTKRPEPPPTPVDYSSDDFHCSKCRISSACLNEESVCCSCERDDLRRQLAASRKRERKLRDVVTWAIKYVALPNPSLLVLGGNLKSFLADCGEGEGDG